MSELDNNKMFAKELSDIKPFFVEEYNNNVVYDFMQILGKDNWYKFDRSLFENL